MHEFKKKHTRDAWTNFCSATEPQCLDGQKIQKKLSRHRLTTTSIASTHHQPHGQQIKKKQARAFVTLSGRPHWKSLDKALLATQKCSARSPHNPSGQGQDTWLLRNTWLLRKPLPSSRHPATTSRQTTAREDADTVRAPHRNH